VRRVVRFAAVWIVLGAALACAPRDERLSVLLVTLDTTRADALSCLGGPPGTTPRLDDLAARSALFARARSDSNTTNPSHVSIMTGLRALDHGVMNHLTRVPDGVDTLAEALGRAGYATGGFASARHVGPDLGWRGFEALPNTRRERGARETTDLALEWLSGVKGRPYFLWVHYWDPHMQYEPDPELAKRFYRGDRSAGSGPRLADQPYFRLLPREGVLRWLGDTRDPAWAPAMYHAEVYYTDAQVGRLLDAAAARGGERTLVVVTADHGEALGEHGIYYAHSGLYEPQLHVPLIVHVPGLAPLRSEAPVSTLDVAPTVAELTGVPLQNEAMAGVSLARVLRGEPDPRVAERTTFVHQNAHNFAVAVRKGDWKLIWPIASDHPVLGTQPQLFDLASDPGETRDLAAQEPARLAELRQLAEPWLARGPIERRTEHLAPEAVEQLRALGYLRD
jgi:arylsulfatase A-like enzyme